MPDIATSPADSLLAKAEPISEIGGTSVKKCLRKGRKWQGRGNKGTREQQREQQRKQGNERRPKSGESEVPHVVFVA